MFTKSLTKPGPCSQHPSKNLQNHKESATFQGPLSPQMIHGPPMGAGHPIELLSLTQRSNRSAQRLPKPELPMEEEVIWEEC